MQRDTRTWRVLSGAVLLATAGAVAWAAKPTGSTASAQAGDVRLTSWRIAAAHGVRVTQYSAADGTAQTNSGVKAEFVKPGGERRMLALAGKVGGHARQPRSLVMRHRLDLTRGEAPHLAVLVLEKGGGAYFTKSPAPVEAGGESVERISLTALRPAAFSTDADGSLDWLKVETIWLGLVLDEPAAGVWSIRDAALSPEPWRPTRPLMLGPGGRPAWQVGKDPAAQATCTTDTSGTMHLAFTIPGGRHMYIVPWTEVRSADVRPYRGLGLQVKGHFPPGSVRLLVSLTESGGGQYYWERAPLDTDDWLELNIPFADFKPASWSPDQNGKLDLDQLLRVNVGLHGTTTAAKGHGLLMARNIRFLPPAGPAASQPTRNPPPAGKNKSNPTR